MLPQASREHYCVNKQVMKKTNKDEECTNLIGADGAGCQYFKNTASKMYGQQNSQALQVLDHNTNIHLRKMLKMLHCDCMAMTGDLFTCYLYVDLSLNTCLDINAEQ